MSATFGIEHPRPQLKRRLVACVPLVAAGELGHPEAVFVPVKTDDRALHASKGMPDDSSVIWSRARKGVGSAQRG